MYVYIVKHTKNGMEETQILTIVCVKNTQGVDGTTSFTQINCMT